MNTVKMIYCSRSFCDISNSGVGKNLEPLKPGEAIAIMPDGHMAQVHNYRC